MSQNRLFVRSVPGVWGKVWLFYGDREHGRPATLSENHYILPKLSPTSDKFSCSNSRGHLIVFDTLGNQLADLGRVDFETWAPSGDFISFCRVGYSHYDIEASDIWIARYDGTETQQLTDTPDVIETGGVFSPTGRFLAYTNERTREIYVIELK